MFKIQQILMFSWIFALSHSSQVQKQNLTKNNNNKKLNVLVLYESLCPDSVNFMASQLGPNYDALKDYINVRLVPFGKSYSEDNGAEFYCQHGPNECEGNRKQSCALNQTENQAAQVKFAVCAMTQRALFDSCATSNGLSLSKIGQCVKAELGEQLQLQAEEITNRYRLDFVPTIIYDDDFIMELHKNSLHDFRGTVCGLLQLNEIVVDIDEVQLPCSAADKEMVFKLNLSRLKYLT